MSAPLQRSNDRNCRAFLDTNLTPSGERQGEGLILVKKNLKRVNFNEMRWSERIVHWFKGETSLRKISEFVINNHENWRITDKNQRIKLEKQFARLEEKWKKSEIPLKNPYQKTLKIVVKYFDLEKSVEKVATFDYNRLTSKDSLEAKVKTALGEDVVFQIFTRSKIGASISVAPVSIKPDEIFKKITQQPPTMFDPSAEDPADVGDRVVTVTLEDPDSAVLNQLIMQQGAKLQLPPVPAAPSITLPNDIEFNFTESNLERILNTQITNAKNDIKKTVPEIFFVDKPVPPTPPIAGAAAPVGAAAGSNRTDTPEEDELMPEINDDEFDREWEKQLLWASQD